jgi:hypothetical protein
MMQNDMMPPSQPPSIGNINNAAPSGTLQAAPSMSGAGPAGGIGAIMSQMDPQHVAALRGIPQHAMQRLHGAGLIHPELMRHLYGGQVQ